MLRTFPTDLRADGFDLCIVGAGPVGLALAMRCEELGLSVLLLEGGHVAVSPSEAGLGRGHVIETPHHAPEHLVICRALGGASRWWGGRCVPLDDVDFAPRDFLPEAAWPFAHEELARFYPGAAQFFRIGSADFAIPGSRVCEALERWAPEPDLCRLYRRRVERSPRILLVLNATVLRLDLDATGAQARRLIVGSTGGSRVELAPKRIVLACGGLESARLLLASRLANPQAFGGSDGALGRYYMGHLSGKIADIVFKDATTVRAHGFKLDGGVYLRRRYLLPTRAQLHERVMNTAFLVDNLALNEDHQNEVLSLVWLVLSGRRWWRRVLRLRREPRPPMGSIASLWRAHVRNVLRAPAATIAGAWRVFNTRIGAKLFTPSVWMRSDEVWRRRGPELLIGKTALRYALHYHAEQSPDPDSRVTLANSFDPLGMPHLKIDFRFHRRDADSVVRAHELLDRTLRDAGVGELRFHRDSSAERVDDVLRQALDGYHQIGLARMGLDPRTSVVDPHCRVHGVDNLYVASTAVFPSSGQANPTFPAVALALRLAEELAGQTRASAAPARRTDDMRLDS